VFGTFAEYWVHRVFLHRLVWHGVHERHHVDPQEPSILPVWLMPAIFLVAFVLLPLATFAGFVAWYIWFVGWHHWLHHADLSTHPLIGRYAAWHDIHHHGARANYGITVPLWDFLFRTYQRGRVNAHSSAT
jgi:sterol desaturase/sphingolipid hydroxylase (fatty acid hydroxylase superfamily)